MEPSTSISSAKSLLQKPTLPIQSVEKDGFDENTRIKFAFLVWFLITGLGLIGVDPDWFPLFSHSIGFGFFVVLTKNKIRYLGVAALACGIFFVCLWIAMPVAWIVTASHSIGYFILGLFILLTFFFNFLTFKQSAITPNAEDKVVLNQVRETFKRLQQLDWPDSGFGLNKERVLMLKIIHNLESKLDKDSKDSVKRKSLETDLEKLKIQLDVELESKSRLEKICHQEEAKSSSLSVEIELLKKQSLESNSKFEFEISSLKTRIRVLQQHELELNSKLLHEEKKLHELSLARTSKIIEELKSSAPEISKEKENIVNKISAFEKDIEMKSFQLQKTLNELEVEKNEKKMLETQIIRLADEKKKLALFVPVKNSALNDIAVQTDSTLSLTPMLSSVSGTNPIPLLSLDSGLTYSNALGDFGLQSNIKLTSTPKPSNLNVPVVNHSSKSSLSISDSSFPESSSFYLPFDISSEIFRPSTNLGNTDSFFLESSYNEVQNTLNNVQQQLEHKDRIIHALEGKLANLNHTLLQQKAIFDETFARDPRYWSIEELMLLTPGKIQDVERDMEACMLRAREAKLRIIEMEQIRSFNIHRGSNTIAVPSDVNQATVPFLTNYIPVSMRGTKSKFMHPSYASSSIYSVENRNAENSYSSSKLQQSAAPFVPSVNRVKSFPSNGAVTSAYDFSKVRKNSEVLNDMSSFEEKIVTDNVSDLK